jgi:hypothetical protein
VFTRIKRRLTYANVVSSLCLFMVLAGGSAFAATKLTGKDIANNAITSKHVKPRSLLANDFKRGQLPAGPQGAQGAQGAQGVQGVQGVQGPAGDSRAYADVRVDLVTGQATYLRSKGFSGVIGRPAGTNSNIFCLSAPGIDPQTAPLIISVNNQSQTVGFAFENPGGGQCGTAYQVNTYTNNGAISGPGAFVSFNVMIP